MFVQKRYGKDNEFVKKADASIEEVKQWTEKIFSEGNTADFRLPKEMWNWFVETVL